MHNKILETINDVLETTQKLCPECPDQFSEILMNCDRIFVAGAGRSGLVAKFFGMRVAHLGKNISIVGETTTPRIKEKDLLIIISGSGTTSTMIELVKKAARSNADIALVTSKTRSPLVDFATHTFLIGGEGKTTGDIINIMPLGTIFELSALIFLESVISAVIFNYQITEDEMRERHTNLE